MYRYFPNQELPEGSTPQSFHTVIYKASDVVQPGDGQDHASTCKSHELHLKRQEQQRQQQSFRSKDDVIVTTKGRPKRGTTAFEDMLFEHLETRTASIKSGAPVVVSKPNSKTVTTFEVLDWDDVPESVRHHFRKKANLKPRIDPRKRTCMLYLQVSDVAN